ncbi:putative phosducin [Besnoitia besnoiti]|uniref:Putative phosducin n=1 Tax=Besnoitia besnoiti TaxID=94643 RepID=A0A2A9MM03_BESBE|nr:putative phosducin [Besnoitia besnoiti]PFH38324.1 putative phosducin [Besnoitia besnoiti]
MSTTNPEIRDTEWDALQRKFGNLPKLPDVVTEEQLTREVVDAAEKVDSLANKSVRELNELEDDVEEDVLERYRRKRFEEIQQRKKLERFKNKQGTWVVVHLYQNAVPACKAVNEVLPQLAQRHRDIKFMKGIATDIIPNYPDSKVPTMLLYWAGTCRAQVVGLQKEWTLDEAGHTSGKLATLPGLEKFLSKYGVIKRGDAISRDDSDAGSADDESSRGARHLRISYGQAGARRRGGNEDESDDEKDRAKEKGYSSVAFDRKVQRGY